MWKTENRPSRKGGGKDKAADVQRYGVRILFNPIEKLIVIWETDEHLPGAVR